MNKEEYIAKYGEDAYAEKLNHNAEYNRNHSEAIKEYNVEYYKEHSNAIKVQSAKWVNEHPAEVKAHRRKYYEENQENQKAYSKKYREEHPEWVKALADEVGKKGGKYYKKKSLYSKTGLQGKRVKLRAKHRKRYLPYKKTIDPLGLSVIHHEWIPGTARYRGVALVEADQHMHGFVNPIVILEGSITLFTEEEVRVEEAK